MRVLIELTYYRPHVSGLTIYVERLAQALAGRGHQVTVLTSQYDRQLPRREELGGVQVVRVPVVGRLSKAVLMPAIGWEATRLVAASDVISLHLPNPDAFGLALRGRLARKPTVLTYHCDISLPPTLLNHLANVAAQVSNHLSARLADRVVAYTEDYAVHSPFLSRHLSKVKVIPPPVVVPALRPAAVQAFRAQHGLAGQRVVGMAARLATEKGVEYLLAALPLVLQQYPQTKVVFAGPYQNVMGEEAYARRLAPLFEQYRDHWVFAGTLDPAQMTAFFGACDVTVLPSLNSTESFGLVQVEAMLCGTPAIASSLPGVRQPTQLTGMGLTVPPHDAPALAQAICEVLAHREKYVQPRLDVAAYFSPSAVAAQYEQLFASIR